MLTTLNYFNQAVLQGIIDLFVAWFRAILLNLNLRKCKCIVFSRRCLISPTYVINSCPLETMTTFLDLEVLLDMKLYFIDHISIVIDNDLAIYIYYLESILSLS